MRQIRLQMLVEGQTEQAFAQAVLGKHLSTFDVQLQPPSCFTTRRSKPGQAAHKGGLPGTFDRAKHEILARLKQDPSKDVRVTMMADLYALPKDFPGFENGMNLATASKKAEFLEAALAKTIDDRRFIPYLQCHEFEALVLVEPQRIAALYDVRSGKIESLSTACKEFETPEDINLNRNSHPKQRILDVVPDYRERGTDR